MPNPVLSEALARVRRAALARHTAETLGDGQLLDRFIAFRDEECFAALVARHGPMVLAVCRRAAGDAHLAEDAFQATFLVLARRAGDIRPREAVRAWLYGVAVRTAREARSTLARRRHREVPVSRVPDRAAPAEEQADADALRMLDEEIARLPEHLRAAVVLCELDGIGRKEAAVRLGVPEGTLSSRLAKARKVLAERLRGRVGILPAAGLATLLRPAPVVGVPPALADAAVKLALPGPVPAAVAELSRGVFRTMLLTRLKIVPALLVLTVAGWVAAANLLRSPGEQPPGKPSVAKLSPPKKGVATGILYSLDGDLRTTDPEGKDQRRIELPPGAGGSAVPSPDGRTLAYWTIAADEPGRAELCVQALDGKGARIRFKLPQKIGYLSFCWSPDGRELHVNTGTPGLKGVQHLRASLKTKKLTALDLLKTHLVTDWTRDGKYFLTTGVGDGDEWMPQSLHLMRMDGTEHEALTGPRDVARMGRLSPDGKRLLCISNDKLAVLTLGFPGSPVPVQGIAENVTVVDYAWSPDGKRIAYATGTTRILTPEELRKVESRLIVADPDGKNAKVLRSVKGRLISRVHWR